MADEMKHCPFCGDSKFFTAARRAKVGGVYIGKAGCAMCGASIAGTADTFERAVSKAIEAWNTRPREEKND